MKPLDLSLPGLSAPPYDPAAHARMRAETVNALTGDLTGYDCPKCRNRGVIAFPREDGSIFTRECNCMTIRRCVWEMEKSGLKNSIRAMTFDAYNATEPWQQILKNGARDYAEKPEGWLLLCGQSGCGKTHLCTAVCRQQLYNGQQVRYMPWRDKIATVKALSLDSPQRTLLMDSWKQAQILYIDDLYKTGRGPEGTEHPTGADVNLAFEIINYRYINHLPTIISTEKMPQELVQIDEATGSRIIEAAGSHVYAVSLDQKRNYRLRGVVNL